jgi:type II secretory ATPase GspE/PulE/Tfp pilus assembly ATPase PilB-like protein
MRSILRQDPDIIMIGEMRDRETCEMAIQAALTGHRCSRPCTQMTPASLHPLVDMGLEPNLITIARYRILAQRRFANLHKVQGGVYS